MKNLKIIASGLVLLAVVGGGGDLPPIMNPR